MLSIQDQGVGIPAADLPRVFDRVHRGANVAGHIPGAGIGLAGVRQIVEMHGGRVRVESTEGAGTTVTLWLPSAPPPTPHLG
jgi:signal transduction histidine kinase